MNRVGLDDFALHGAQLFRCAIKPFLTKIAAALAPLPPHRAGIRIHGLAPLAPFLAPDGCIGAIAALALGPRAKPVRAILFSKTAETNWSLGWHQDRTICVRKKRDVAGFGPWTVKSGMHHVAPPFALLEGMVTLRAHLDDVPASNAPLMIAPGPHRLGRIAESEIDDVVKCCGTMICTARAGDLWLYATPILHASEASSAPATRRVLQVDFAAEDLPAELCWSGV